MSVGERSERERVALAIYESRLHTSFIHGWNAEPEALRARFLKAADAALGASGAVEERDALAAAFALACPAVDTRAEYLNIARGRLRRSATTRGR